MFHGANGKLEGRSPLDLAGSAAGTIDEPRLMGYPSPPRVLGAGRGSVYAVPPEAPTKGPTRARKPHRAFLMGFSLVVLLYSLAVLLSVAWMGDIGVRCIFGNEVKEPISAGYEWAGGHRPAPGDQVVAIGGMRVSNYSDYIKAMRGLSRLVGTTVQVSWLDRAARSPITGLDGVERSAAVRVRYRPATSYLWSVVWFLQEMVIFAIGARVFWKRPLTTRRGSSSGSASRRSALTWVGITGRRSWSSRP